MMDYTTLFDAVLIENERREADLNRIGSVAGYASRESVRHAVAAGLVKIAGWVAGEALSLAPANENNAPALA